MTRSSSSSSIGISIHALREEGDSLWLSSGKAQKHFYPRPPRGGRRRASGSSTRGGRFLSTPSARRATFFRSAFRRLSTISIHALREEGDRRAPRRQQPGAISIHALREEGDQAQSGRPLEHRLISIHALREEGDPPASGRWRREQISIHALREEGDSIGCATFSGRSNFYPRPPRGGRPVIFIVHPPFGQFLSTPSARRATRARSCACRCDTISIHALREEGDYTPSRQQVYAERFLSTPSARRATYFFMVLHSIKSNFYPRPPRGGRHAIAAPKGQVQNFYPRPPRGGRRRGLVALVLVRRFLSTPSARRATAAVLVFYELDRISIHALREEGDQHSAGAWTGTDAFLSTPSARRATHGHHLFVYVVAFLSTPSARRATCASSALAFMLHIFLSTPSARRATPGVPLDLALTGISIHALCEEGDAFLTASAWAFRYFYPRPPRGGRRIW